MIEKRTTAAFLLLTSIAGCRTAHPLPIKPAAEATATHDVVGDFATSHSGSAGDSLAQLLTAPIEVRRPNGQVQEQIPAGWYVDRHESDARPATASYLRWRHTGLDRWLAIAPGQRPDLRRAVDSPNRDVATVAIIGAARHTGVDYRVQLMDIARATSQDLGARCAAIETLASTSRSSPVSDLENLLEQFARLDTPAVRPAYVPALHAELLRGLARHVDVRQDPRFSQTLSDPAVGVDVKQTVLELFAASPGEVPAQVVALLDDSRSPLRLAALRAIGDSRYGPAAGRVRHLLNDPDISVRLAAIDALGKLGTDEARGALRIAYATQPDRIRSAVVDALAAAGDREAVYAAVDDTSWQVRVAVAHALGNDGNTDELAAARRLLHDRSANVQLAVLDALQTWPLADAGPLLLEATTLDGYRLRSQAWEQLRTRWAPATAIPQNRIIDDGAHVVAELRAAWDAEFGIVFAATTGDEAESIDFRGNGRDWLPEQPTTLPEPDDSQPAAPFDRTAMVAQLTEMLASADRLQRVEAAAALSAIGNSTGVAALERLTFDYDWSVRRRATIAIGELHDPLFLPTVIRLLDDESAVRREALTALPKILGHDVVAEQSPPPAVDADKAAVWKAWYFSGGNQ